MNSISRFFRAVFIFGLIAAANFAATITYTMISGCESSKKTSYSPAGSASTPPQPVSELEKCGYGGSDCRRFNDVVETIGKSKAASLGDELGLDCSGSRQRFMNADGTWNVCACICRPGSQIPR